MRSSLSCERPGDGTDRVPPAAVLRRGSEAGALFLREGILRSLVKPFDQRIGGELRIPAGPHGGVRFPAAGGVLAEELPSAFADIS